MSTAPVITVGMDENAVEKLLGKPASKRDGGTILGGLARNPSQLQGMMGQMAARAYAIYKHPAGTYEIVFSGGKVVEVHSQPGS